MIKSNQKNLFISYQNLSKDIKVGELIMLDDGKIQLINAAHKLYDLPFVR